MSECENCYCRFGGGEMRSKGCPAEVAEEAEKELESLRAENAALKAQLKAEEWRPIEEAPKDGRVVLVWSKVDEYVQTGRHLTGTWHDWIGERLFPTHYRPLPQPPEVM